MPIDPTQADPSIVALMHGLKTAEGANRDYNAIGDNGTAAGIGQWSNQVNGKPVPLQKGQIPTNFQAMASRYGLDPNDFSPENQNKVMYSDIAAAKKQGLTPEQYLSRWNSGDANKYQTAAAVGVGPVGAYNVSDYVKRGMTAAQQYAQQRKQQTAQPQDQSFLSQVGGNVATALGGAGQAFTQAGQGQINPLSGLLQGAGALGKGVGDITNTALTSLPVVGGVIKGAESLIGQGASALAQTTPGKTIIGQYEQWAQAHPELANDVGAVGNIATALPVLRGLGIAKEAVGGAVSTALRGTGDAVLDTIAPRLTANETAQAIAQRGTTTKGLLRETQIAPDPRLQPVVQAVNENVPKFDPSKPLTYNIAVTKNAATQMASKLDADVDTAGAGRIYSFRELGSYLQNLDKPLSLVGENATQYNRLVNAAMQIAQQEGGKVSSLLDVRKKFDALVSQTYPNLYESDTLTPLRLGIQNIRNGITKFTAQNLPEGVGLREKLLTQHHLLTAVENMSGKAAKGATKEIGGTALTRFAGRHPIMSGVVKSLGRGALLGTGIKGAESLVP